MIRLDGCAASSLPLPDRGLEFGDGLFETLLVRSGQALFLDYHIQRLQQGLRVLGIPDCHQAAREQVLLAAAECTDPSRGSADWSSLRLTVTRGAGPRGYAPPRQALPRLLTSTSSLNRDCREMAPPATLTTATVRWSTQPFLAGIKHLNKLEQVLAAAQARDAGCDDAIMLGQSGEVVSVSSGNLFAVIGRRVVTPPLQEYGVAGTRRRLILSRWAPALGFTVSESALQLVDLEAADEVFCSNSLTGARPVRSIPGRSWSEHPVCSALHKCFLGELT